MHQLDFAISASRAEVLPDESFDVTIIVSNNGAAAFEVPDPETTSEFQFVLRSVKDERIIHLLDAAAAYEARTGDPMEEEAPDLVSLEPGARITYTYDLAQFYVTALTPDSYRLSVKYGRESDIWESPEIPLSIVSPQIRALAAVYGPAEENINHVFANLEADGSVAIYQRESFEDQPDGGVVCRHITFQPGQSISGMADAIELYYSRGIRWFAWLEGDALGAAVAQYRKLFARLEPVPLGLQSPVLYDKGWQPEDESATFVALGLDQGGHVGVAAVTLPPGEKDTVQLVPLSLSKIPTNWAVHYRAGEEKAQFDVVAGEDMDGKTRLAVQTVNLQTGVAGPPAILAERDGPIAALALAPVAGDEPGVADALFGPVGSEAQMTFLRTPLVGGEPLKEVTFAAPRNIEGKEQPSHWTIPVKPLAIPMVLVKFGDRLMVRDVAEGAEWSTVVEDAAGAEYISLEVMGDGTVWAMWVDPDIGIRYLAVR